MAINATGLLGHYKCDDIVSDGEPVLDSGPFGHNGTAIGGGGGGGGQVNGEFGMGGSIKFSVTSTLQPSFTSALSGATEWTVSYWARRIQSSNRDMLVFNGDTTLTFKKGGSGINVNKSGGPGAYLNQNGVGDLIDSDLLGFHYHIVAISKAINDHELWVNNSLVATSTTSVAMPDNITSMIAGGNSTPKHRHDEMTVWTRAISAAERNEIYTQGLAGLDISYQHFPEGSYNSVTQR